MIWMNGIFGNHPVELSAIPEATEENEAQQPWHDWTVSMGDTLGATATACMLRVTEFMRQTRDAFDCTQTSIEVIQLPEVEEIAATSRFLGEIRRALGAIRVRLAEMGRDPQQLALQAKVQGRLLEMRPELEQFVIEVTQGDHIAQSIPEHLVQMLSELRQMAEELQPQNVPPNGIHK